MGRLCWLLEFLASSKVCPKMQRVRPCRYIDARTRGIGLPQALVACYLAISFCMTKRGFLFCFWMHCKQIERLTIMNVTLGRAPFEPQRTALQPSNTSRNALIKMVRPRWLRSYLTPEAREYCHTSMRETQPNYRHESVVALKYSAPLATVAYAESMTACTGIVLTGVHCLYLSVAPTLY
jgi:hypothetical protein